MSGAQILLRQLPLATVAYCPRGPVATPDELPNLLPHLHAAAKRAGAVFLKVEPHWLAAQADVLKTFGFQPAQGIQPPNTIVLDLSQTEEQLLANMKQKWRYNIRLAHKKGVTVRPATAADLDAWYALMEVTGVRDNVAIHSQDYYNDAFHQFCDGKRGVLLVAEYEGEMLGGVMIFALGPEATYVYGASGNTYRNLMPNHALQWAAIRWAKAQRCSRYDFWGIPPEVAEDGETMDDGRWTMGGGRRTADDGRKTVDDEAAIASDHTSSLTPHASRLTDHSSGLWGVYRFKQGFGGRVVRYADAYDYIYNAPLYWAGTSLLPRVRSWLATVRR